MKNILKASLVALASTSLLMTGAGAAQAHAKSYANCTAMHRDYPHGIGKVGARDKTSGTPVTNFKRSNAGYNANTKSDRDKDGIACEAR